MSTARSLREEIEPHVPYTSALDAIGACLPLLERFPDDYPLDVRTIAGDDGWLSPSQGQESISINLSRTYRKDNGPFYRAVEEALAPFPGRGRPHWGKQPHLRTADFYREIYPRWDEFIALRRQLDPTGTFLNEALRGLLE
jgi:FAD/FMN-containing dehydrogenase